MKPLLIGIDDLYNHTELLENVDAKLISASIRRAQDLYIEPVVGTKLLKKVSDLIVNQELDLSGNTFYKELYDDYMFISLIETTLYLSFDSISVRIGQNGVVILNSENNTPMSKNELNELKQQRFEYSKHYLEKMRDYLSWNYSKFPELGQSLETQEEGGLKKTQSLIYFRKKGYDYRDYLCYRYYKN